jgi:branched-chain amino acid aminotransferase
MYLTAGAPSMPHRNFAMMDGFAPSLMIWEEELKPLHPEAPNGLDVHERGIKIKMVPFARELASVKTVNYSLGYHAARVMAGKEWDDVLFTSPDGYVTEAVTSNFFCVIGGVLCTPSRGMLHGVTRKVLLELAKQNSIPVTERDIKPAELARATEAWITGSYAEMLPVRHIDALRLPTTTDGAVYKKLRQALTAYREQVCGS